MSVRQTQFIFLHHEYKLSRFPIFHTTVRDLQHTHFYNQTAKYQGAFLLNKLKFSTKSSSSSSSSLSKHALHHMISCGNETPFYRTSCRFSAPRRVLQNLFTCPSSIHSVAIISPVTCLFVCIPQYRFCLEFLHYFLTAFVVPFCTTRSTPHKPHFRCCDSGFITVPNGPRFASVGQPRSSKSFINIYSGVSLY